MFFRVTCTLSKRGIHEEIDLLDGDSGVSADAVQKAFKDCQIDPTCSFEPPKTKSRKRVGGQKKHYVSVYDETDSELSSIKSTQGKITKEKRDARTRKKPSKNFTKSLQKAIRHGKRIKAQKILDEDENSSFSVTIKSESTVQRTDGQQKKYMAYIHLQNIRIHSLRLSLLHWSRGTGVQTLSLDVNEPF